MAAKQKYDERFVKIAKVLCMRGGTDEDLADAFEVSPRTINRWKKDYPEFAEALAAGKEYADAEVELSLYKRAKGSKQFDEMMGKWGLDPEKDLDKIYRIPGGGFIQKKDHKHFHEVLDRHNAEMEAAKAADEDGTGFLYQMFKYELDNHEYGYTGDLEDTLDCLGLTWEELKASPVMLKALDKASTEIREREGC